MAPIIPTHLLIQAHALTLVTVSYFLLTAPATILTCAPVVILGGAMHVRPFVAPTSTPGFTTALRGAVGGSKVGGEMQTSDSLALVGLMLVLGAVMEAVFAGTLALPSGGGGAAEEEDGAGAPGAARSSAAGANRVKYDLYHAIRTQSTFLSFAGLRTFVTGSLVAVVYISGRMAEGPEGSAVADWPLVGRVLELVGNDVVLSSGLLETMFWGYVYINLGDERKEVLQRIGMETKDE